MSSPSSRSRTYYHTPATLSPTPPMLLWSFHLPPALSMFLHGTVSRHSPLRLLRGQTSTLLRIIWTMSYDISKAVQYDHKAWVKCGELRCAFFPQPTGFNVNMMPFVMGKRASIPPELHGYWNMIEQIGSIAQCDGTTCYLTIDERLVNQGECHRRGGMHVEAPGMFAPGHGGKREEMKDGIYMVSNVEASCRIWSCRVVDDTIMGQHGSLQYCKQQLEARVPSESCAANTIYWLTDRTPHSAVPLYSTCTRQYVRVVTSRVTYWFADHSTWNPLCKPKANIIYGNKYHINSLGPDLDPDTDQDQGVMCRCSIH